MNALLSRFVRMAGYSGLLVCLDEMVNLYTSGEQGVVMTHYCHMGNQPRMRAKPASCRFPQRRSRPRPASNPPGAG